jgi:hypothetical protein
MTEYEKLFSAYQAGYLSDLWLCDAFLTAVTPAEVEEAMRFVNNLLNRIGFEGSDAQADAQARELVSVSVRRLHNTGSAGYSLGAPFVRCDRCSRILCGFDVVTDPLTSTARLSANRFMREMGIIQ